MSSPPWRLVKPVVLTLGLVACSDGCAHDLPATDQVDAEQRLSLEQLDGLLWPDTKDDLKLLPERELVMVEELVTLLLARAKAGGLSGPQARRAQAYAALLGLDLRAIDLEMNGEVERVWALLEPADDRRGRGSYLFRVGELEPRGGRADGAKGRRRRANEQVLQAPHSRYDKHSGEIALALFGERWVGTAPPRALFVNSVHRYRQYDGSRDKNERAELNPADAAHQPDHPIARATAMALRKHEIALIQLHGFEREAGSGDPEIIVSSGEDGPRPASAGVLRRLKAAMPEFTMAHYGVDIDRLGARRNVQGRAARDARRCFVHIETSESVRELLRTDAEARRRFATAVFGGDAGELRGGCR